MTENLIGTKQELYLAPEEEKITNAAEIAAVSENMERFVFTVFYVVSDKQVILSELKRIGAVIVDHSDENSAVTVKMSKEQLSAIKMLEGVERVEMAESTELSEKSSTSEETYDIISTQQTFATNDISLDSESSSNTGEISLMCYDDGNSSGSDCNCSNSMQSAVNLTLNSWQSGEICCPGTEMWYKFTPSSTAYYTIYTVGSLDTVGYLYDANCNQIDDNDDGGTGLNFKIVARLTAGQTYYIKASAFGSNTGDFSIAVTSTVFVEYVSINQSSIVLDKGETKTLTATVSPSYATNKTLRWGTSDSSVATVDESGVVTARGAGIACICAFSRDGSEKSSCCEVSVNVPVKSVTINTSSLMLRVGEYDYLSAEVCPTDAVNQLIRWSSSNTNVVWVNEATGRVEARGVGSATVYATAQDGTGVKGSCAIQVEPPIAVQGIDICCDNCTMNIGDTTYLSYDIYPSDATNKSVTWCSSNTSVAEVNASTGKIVAQSAGMTTITVTTNDGSYVDSCEVWVHGKTPVFLIHGRTDNSKGVWGINNNIPSGKNNDFKSDINAKALNGKKYIEVDSQELGEFEPNNGNGDADYPYNLGNKLLDAGYQKNVNLFAFNYPNQDAVVHSAKKFKKYIENLIDDVRTSGTDEKKACFYASRNDYNNNNYKINIVGHSMGGLVARYYIENLGHDGHVDKLITICTPHWGSGYADISCGTGEIAELGMHKLCDHDLRFNSKMYGGSFSTELDCNAMFELNQCYTGDYLLTDELLFDKTRNTKYYAIAGIDYPIGLSSKNDITFEMPTNFTTTQQIVDYFTEMGIYSFSSTNMSIIEINIKGVGDNMVGFLSQIGWIGDNPDINTPEPRIQMEKIFIDVDTNGGNGNGIPGFEVLNLLHNKIPHRDDVTKQILYYLCE